MAYGHLDRMQKSLPAGSGRAREIGYRYPLEGWMLLIVGLAILASPVFSLGGLALFFVVGLVINYLFIRSIIAGFRRDAVQVSETQFPEINDPGR